MNTPKKTGMKKKKKTKDERRRFLKMPEEPTGLGGAGDFVAAGRTAGREEKGKLAQSGRAFQEGCPSGLSTV